MSELLKICNVNIRFRSKGLLRSIIDKDKDPYIDVVCNVSLTINQGETYAIVGESGAGKTTLAKAIIGLVTPNAGSILYQGSELCGLSNRAFNKYRRNIAMMFQDPTGSLSPRMTVRSLITEPFKIHEVKNFNPEYESDRLLEMVNLPRFITNLYPHQLSGGQARRVGLARALALSPKLIIADEPTAGLDVSVQGDILNLISQLQREVKLNFMIITHNLAVVRHISSRMAIMYLGRFVEQGATDEIFQCPRHPYTHALLSSTPDPDPDAPRKFIKLQGETPSLLEKPSGCEFHTRCPSAQEICRREFPPLEHPKSGHSVLCHFFRNEYKSKPGSGTPD